MGGFEGTQVSEGGSPRSVVPHSRMLRTPLTDLFGVKHPIARRHFARPNLTRAKDVGRHERLGPGAGCSSVQRSRLFLHRVTANARRLTLSRKKYAGWRNGGHGRLRLHAQNVRLLACVHRKLGKVG